MRGLGVTVGVVFMLSTSLPPMAAWLAAIACGIATELVMKEVRQ